MVFDAEAVVAERDALRARLRDWEETAEHYCAPETDISPDGVRGYVDGLRARAEKAEADNARLYKITIADKDEVESSAKFMAKLAAIARALPPEKAGLARELKEAFDVYKTLAFVHVRDLAACRAEVARVLGETSG